VLTTVTRVLFLLLVANASPLLAGASAKPCGRPGGKGGDARSYYRIGLECEKLGKHEQALEAFNRARQLSPHNPGILRAAAETFLRLDRLTDALGALAELVPLESKNIEPLLLRQARGAQAPPDPAEAIRFYQRRRDQARSRKDRLAEARALEGLAHASAILGKERDTERNYRAALQLARYAKDPTLEADILLDSAGSYKDLDRYDEAIENYDRSAQYSLKKSNHEHAAKALIGRGEARQLIGDLDQGEQSFWEALGEARRAGDRNLQVRVLAMLASVAADRENVELMTERIGEALSNLQRLLQDWFTGRPVAVGFPITLDGAIALQMLGEVEAWSGHFESAIACSKLALALHRVASRTQGDALGDISLDLYHLGIAYTQAGRLEEAWAALEEVRRVAERLHDPDDYFLFNQMGTVRERQGSLKEALKLYAHATEILERIGHKQRAGAVQVSLREQKVAFYLSAVSALLKLQSSEPHTDVATEAFAYLERGRAQTLLDLLNESRNPRSQRLGDIKRALSEQGQAGHEKHADLTAALAEEEADMRAERANASPAAQPHFASPEIASVADIQSLLNDRTALLEYALGQKVSGEGVAALWVITRHGVHVHELSSGDTVADLVRGYRKTLEAPLITRDEIESHAGLAEELYRVLVQPAANDIEGKHRLVIVPAGSLYYLPFETLIEPNRESNGARRQLSSLRYIGKTHAVNYAPSASVLLFLDKKERAQRTDRGTPQLPLVAFGDPVYGSGPQATTVASNVRGTYERMVHGFTPLPYSAEEVKRIGAVFGVTIDSDGINLRERATKERLEKMDLTRYRMLHFATHAVVGDQVTQLTQPALVLSDVDPSKPEAEFLRMSEIFDLRLNAELVVLSACKTAEGKFYRGEGLVGLTSAFLRAGSRSVVASLWPVNDQSTSLFMESFYKGLKAGKPKAEALRLARNQIMESTVWSDALGREQSLAAPFYWAPFILIGGPH